MDDEEAHCSLSAKEIDDGWATTRCSFSYFEASALPRSLSPTRRSLVSSTFYYQTTFAHPPIGLCSNIPPCVLEYSFPGRSAIEASTNSRPLSLVPSCQTKRIFVLSCHLTIDPPTTSTIISSHSSIISSSSVTHIEFLQFCESPEPCEW